MLHIRSAPVFCKVNTIVHRRAEVLQCRTVLALGHEQTYCSNDTDFHIW